MGQGHRASRGYATVGLVNVKDGYNLGGAMRAVQVFGGQLVVASGARAKVCMRHPTDTMKAWKHVPTILVDDVFDALPYDCMPIAVELNPNATPLWDFAHPERAMYVFGAEDATLGREVTDRCAATVFVPTKGCMNLAAAINVTLFARMAWRERSAV